MNEGVVMGWRKQVGDRVERDEILFEMETDKVVVEVPAPASGILLRIDVAEGAASVEQPVGWIGVVGDVIPDWEPAAHASSVRAPEPMQMATPETAMENAASPAARRRAREIGIDLRQVRGTGPGGRITEFDVEKASQRR